MATQITNPKIHSVDPVEFTRHNGFSYLFDNLGYGLSEDRGLQYLWNAGRQSYKELADGGLGLYEGLEAGISQLCCSASRLAMCPLDPRTYHVTLWDGVNDGNLDLLAQPWHGRFKAFLLGLPESAGRFLPDILPPPVMQLDTPWTAVRFRFKELALWPKAYALVAVLELADGQSAWAVGHIRRWREEMDRQFAAYGKPANRAWTPHCSLAYFPDEAAVEAAGKELAAWNELIQKHTAGRTIQFDSASLYAFTNMERFWLCRLPAVHVSRPVIKSAIAAEIGYLGSKGDQKILITHQPPLTQRLGQVLWKPLAPNGKRHCQVTKNIDLAVFNEHAPQQQHAHEKQTEVYIVVQGLMKIEIESVPFELSAGDMIVVNRTARHDVKRDSAFLAIAIGANSELGDKIVSTFPVFDRDSGVQPALVVRRSILRQALSDCSSRLAARGDQKILVVDSARPDEITPPPDMTWVPVTRDGKFPVQAMRNVELAIFTGRAKQDCHFHRLATEIYHVIDGVMRMMIDGHEYTLHAGDTIVVNPWVIHQVERTADFLALVISVNSGGSSDKYVADFLPFDERIQRNPFWRRGVEELNERIRAAHDKDLCPRKGVTLVVGHPLPEEVFSKIREARELFAEMVSSSASVKWRDNLDALHITVYGVIKPDDYASMWPLAPETHDRVVEVIRRYLPLTFRIEGLGVLGDGAVALRVTSNASLELMRAALEEFAPAVSGRAWAEHFSYAIIGRLAPGLTEEDRQRVRD
jgi:mannose-6-phosphate isomerase-like protein (cupin superfamily)